MLNCTVQPDLEGKGELIAAFIGAAIVFGAGIWGVLGAEKAQEYFAGYLLEQSLSVDNLFVFILVFKYFKTPGAEQEKVCSLWQTSDLPANCCVRRHHTICKGSCMFTCTAAIAPS